MIHYHVSLYSYTIPIQATTTNTARPRSYKLEQLLPYKKILRSDKRIKYKPIVVITL